MSNREANIDRAMQLIEKDAGLNLAPSWLSIVRLILQAACAASPAIDVIASDTQRSSDAQT